MAGMNPGPNRNAQWCAAMSDRLVVSSDAVSPPTTWLRSVTIDSRLIAPTTRMAASSVREVMKPIAADAAEAPHDRIQRDGRADAGDGADEVHEAGEDHAFVAAVPEDPVGVVDQWRLEGEGRDRCRERHEIEHAGRQGELAGVAGFHVIPLRVGVASRRSAGRRCRAASGASRAVRPGRRSGPG